jgi:hypothetical protein
MKSSTTRENNYGHDFLVYGAILLVGVIVYSFRSTGSRMVYFIGGLAIGAGVLGLTVLLIRVIYRLLQKV